MATFKTCVQRPRKDGNYVVYIRITHNRSVAYINTDYLVDKKQIDRKGEITEPFINKQCAIRIAEYIDRCNRANIKDWLAKEIADYLTKGFEVMSFSDYCRLFTQRMDEEGRETTSQNYKLAIARLEEFSGKKTLKFSDVTSKLINDWIASMKNTRYAKNGYPKAIKAMFQHGCDEFNDYDRDIIRITNQPFRKVSIPKPKVPVKRAVDVDMLKRFFGTDISGMKAPKGTWISRAERAKDVCMLIFCLAGINTADLYDLKPENFKNGKLCYNRKKTRGRRDDEAYIEIEIPRLIIPLFNKYKGKKALFNFAETYANQKNFNKCINEGIGDIRACYNETHLDQLEYVTTYSFRHSWATIAQNQCHASTELIAFSLNHGSAHKTTERYIKKDYSPISKLNRQVIALVFNGNS